MKLAQRIVVQYYRSTFKILSHISPKMAAKKAFDLFCTPYTKTRDKQAPDIFKLAQPLTLKVVNDTVHGFLWSTSLRKQAETILICHGFDSCSYRFAEFIQPLLNGGFNVIAFDAPAHGLSSGRTITLLQYGEMIKLVNERFGPIYGIMAHSFGGLSVVLALEDNKDFQCQKLVLISPSTETTHAVESFFAFLNLPGSIRKHFLDTIETLGGNPINWYSVKRAIHNVKPKTLWIHDKEDSITPFAHMETLTVNKPDHLIFEITSGLGHSPYRNAGIRQKIISFFAE